MFSSAKPALILVILSIFLFACSEDKSVDPLDEPEEFSPLIEIDFSGRSSDAILLADSTFIITGGTADLYGTPGDMIIMRVDRQSNIHWMWSQPDNGDYFGYKIFELGDSTFAAIAQDDSYLNSIAWIKFDIDGNILANTVLDFTINNQYLAAFSRSDGSINLVTKNNLSGFFQIYNFDTNASLIASTLIHNVEATEVTDVDQNENDEIYILYSALNDNNDEVFYVLKFGVDNRVSWIKELEVTSTFYSIAAMTNGNFCLFEMGYLGNMAVNNFVYMNDDGQYDSRICLFSGDLQIFYDMIVTTQNQIVITGHNGPPQYPTNPLLVSMELDGNLNWEWQTADDLMNIFHNIKQLENGDIITTGGYGNNLAFVHIPYEEWIQR